MRQLLNFGRKAPLNFSKVDIDDIVRECCELLEYRLKTISLDTDLHLREHYCIDIQALRQIIVNTALNAIQDMPGGGSLSISIRRRRTKIIIEVRDTGTGIDF